MQLYLKTILAACLLNLTAHAQTFTKNLVLKPGSPESAGMSTARLARIDKLLQNDVDSGFVSGIAGMIVRNGVIVYNKSFGYRDGEKKVRLQPDDIFRIASQTKAITSAAVMILFEEGKFLLDDPISNYIPEFGKPVVLTKFNPADTTYETKLASREITIRDLLTHTAGVGYGQIGSSEARAIYAKAGVTAGMGVGRIKLADAIKRLGKCPLFHNPGEKFTYGMNTDILGYLVEVTSGMSLSEFFQARIFKPLGMKDSYFYLPENKKGRLVMLHSDDPKTHKAVPMQPTIQVDGDFYRDYPVLDGTYYSGGAGLSSTMLDYAIFLQMLMNGGEYNGVRVLSRNAVRMMITNQVGNIDMGGGKFGLGFGLTTAASSGSMPQQEGTFEWGGMFATTYWADPKEKLIALVYRNIWPTVHGNSNKYKVLVYGAIND